MKKTLRILIFLLAINVLFFSPNAFCGPLEGGAHNSEFHHPHTAGAFPHYRNHPDGSVPTPVTTPFDVTFVDPTQGKIRQFGNITIIKIFSSQAILEGNLSTNSGDIVKIRMLSSADSVLLRSNTGLATTFLGKLFSNAKVFMVNTAGFVFGSGSEVRAASIVISTLNISNAEFLEGCRTGRFNFIGQGSYIINNGRLVSQPGGYVCLLSQAIKNTGTIQAALGHIILASGEKMTMALDDLGTVSVVIDEAVQHEVFGPDGVKFSSAIENTGTISANGGTVTLTAKSLNKVFDYAINNTGVIEAKSLENKDGRVELVAPDGPIVSTGELKTSFLYERGASFLMEGANDIRGSDIQNADGALDLGTGSYTGEYWDTGDINILANAIITLTGDTTFYADSDQNGIGKVNIAGTAQFVGNNHDLSIFTSGIFHIYNQYSGIRLFSIASSNPAVSYNVYVHAWPSSTPGGGLWVGGPKPSYGSGGLYAFGAPPAPIYVNMNQQTAASATLPASTLVTNLLQSNSGDSKIIYETLKNYKLSANTANPLIYFYHPLTPVDQSAFDNITLDTGAYDFINNSLDLKKHPATYYGL